MNEGPLFDTARLPAAGRRMLSHCGLALGLVLCCGCVSARYKSASRDTPPAAVLDLTGAPAPLLVTVKSVIVFRGPGSWKRDAYWDEYVVSLTNQTGSTVTLESAVLTDFTGTTSPPSDNPWLLEQQSRTREEELQANVKNVLVQIGGGYVGLSLATTGGLAAGGFLGGVIAIPAYVAGTIYSNARHRHQIEAEFARRRLVPPLVIAPGRTVQGSFFFRLSPGPRDLTLLLQHDGSYQKVAVNLAPLANLHLRTKP